MYGVENYEDRTKETCSFFPCRKKWSNGDVHQEWWCTKGECTPGTPIYIYEMVQSRCTRYPFICLSTDENHGHWHQTNLRVRCCPVRPFDPAMILLVHPFCHLAQTKFRLGSKKQWLASNRQTNKILHRCQMLDAILLLLPVDATTKEYNTVSTNTKLIHKQPPPPLHTYLLHLFEMWMHAPFH